MSESLAFLRHLKKRRGRQVFSQAVRMYKLHRLPFEKIVGNILEVTQSYGVGYTFPVVASVATQKPELLKTMVASGAEVAIHGYRHLKYPMLSAESQEKDVKKALETFAELGVQAEGFRAPYNAYGEDTPRILERAGFLWDGGIGYAPGNRARTEMFKVRVDGHESAFDCVPVNYLSDDLMVDDYEYTADQMAASINKALDGARKSRAVIAFDLHPIRMGQPEYVSVFDKIISYGKSLGGWFPTVSEAVKFRQHQDDWGGYEFCCLLTGDIDNFYFRDYLKRLG